MTDRPESFRNDSRLDTLRIPPQSIEAEQSVLGGVMLAPEALDIARDILVEADFYRRDHRLIWRSICELADKGKPFDAVTMGEWLEANGLSEQASGTGYLIELASNTPSAANLKAYAEIVFEKSTARKLIEAGTEIVNDGFEPHGRGAEDLLASAQARLQAMASPRGRGGFEGPRGPMKALFQDMQERWESDGWMTGLSSPFPMLDELTFGMQTGDLIIVAARPGMGKTIYGADVARHVAQHHGTTALFELEMSSKQIWQRQVASVGRVPHDWLRSARGFERKHEYFDSEAAWSGVNVAIKALSALPMQVDDTAGLTIDQICSRARALKRAHRDLCLIVVDHLHIIALPGRDVVNELGAVSRKLKALGKELDCAVIALCQLNRAAKDRADKRPTLVELRASGAIEQDADEIWFLHREDYYDKRTHLKGVVELINGKARNFPAGHTVYLRNHFDQMRLEQWVGSLPSRDDIDDEDRPRRGGFRKMGGRDAAAGGD